jgi:hypothetical protein
MTDEYRKIVDVRDLDTLTVSAVESDSVPCLEYDFFTLLVDYERADAAGAVSFYFEFSLDETDWYQNTIYDGGTVTVNTDTESNIQREEITYGGVANEQEFFVYGPIEIDQFAKYMRVAFYESGAAEQSEGDCGAKLVLTRRKQKTQN